MTACNKDFLIENGKLLKYLGCGGDVTIPDGVTSIEEFAFGNCRELTGITIPDGVTDIGFGAFHSCRGLIRAAIPDSMAVIRERAFYDCEGLTAIDIPEGVTKIGWRAFYGCRRLKKVTLPKRLTDLGEEVFYFCYDLSSITIPHGITCIRSRTFAHCKGLRSIAIPENISEINNDAFYGCTGLESITIPDSVRKVGANAFYGCTGLESAVLPDDARGFEAFAGCSRLKEFIIPQASRTCKTVDGVVLSKDGKQLIAYPPGRCCERYDIPETVRKVGDKAFAGAPVKLIFVHKEVEKFSNTAVWGTEKDVPYVAYYNAAFTSAIGKPVYLGPFSEILSRKRRAAMFGFLHALSIGLPEMAPWEESYVDIIRQNPAAFAKIAWQNEALLHLMMKRRLLPAGTAENMARIYSESGRPGLASELRSYLRS